ncbi:MAG: Tm-1-like ATP-binding domain-containing protein [Planctomycetota bacterium]
MPPILAFATCDTKGEELRYLAEPIHAARGMLNTVDVGTLGPAAVEVDVPRSTPRAHACRVLHVTRHRRPRD